jgi:hypothetical protein
MIWYHANMRDGRLIFEIIEDELANNLRRKTPAQRLAASLDMWRFASERLHQMLVLQHRDWDRQQIKVEMRRRLLGSA